MSITDELREYALGWDERNRVRRDLTTIADRIDAEHERLMQEQPFTIDMVPMTDERMAEHGWIRLPKDADGEYIHVGDVLDGYGKTIEVVEMRHGRSGWVLISRDGNGYADTFAFTHHKPTVEDVLAEFSVRVLNSGHQWGLDGTEVIAEYAAKLRLAEGEDA